MPLMASFRAATGQLFSEYSPEETVMLADFLVKCTGVFQAEAKKLREGTAE
ncbi:hypothetical protein [Paenibacillus sp. 32O-W]|uniref:hypothetical protein n=1 Tax=Paenibacillus sp. 32O-W TaxID=1695218 RepID=UPI000AA64E24|nr:hypothetical protein [Paenibacillus sp. 32O-W]